MIYIDPRHRPVYNDLNLSDKIFRNALRGKIEKLNLILLEKKTISINVDSLTMGIVKIKMEVLKGDIYIVDLF